MTRFNLNKSITGSGELGIFDISDESKVRIAVENAGGGNTVTISGRIKGQADFIAIGEISGSDSKAFSVFTYDEIKISCTAYNSATTFVKILASSFNEAGGSAIDIGVPSGDSLEGAETVTFTSSDDTVVIEGNATNNTIDFRVSPMSGAVSSVNGKTGVVVLNKSDIGLGNVDNTSDLNKPISTATQNALDDKYDASNPAGYITSAEAPVQSVNTKTGAVVLDKSDIGLGNVDNTSDLNKPISTATQDALDDKYDASNPAGYITLAEVPAAPVTSVNTQTGDVVLTKSDVGLGNVDNTSDLNKPVSNATQTAINNLESSFKYNQVVYVDKNNTNSYTADGSINKPYKSIEAMFTAITDASASKRYCCIIAPGTYTEANTIRLKGWIDLTSFTTDTVIIGVSGGVTLKWSNNSPGRVFIKDIGLTSGIEILNDNPTGTSGMVLDLDNIDLPSVLFRGRGGGRDFIQLRNDTRVSGTCTIQSAATTIFDSTIIGNLIFNDTGCVAPDIYGSAITGTLRSNYELNVSITSATYDIYIDAWGNNPLSSLTMTSNSAVPSTFNTDADSYPSSITLSGSPSPVVVRTTEATAVRYDPTTPANWSPSVDNVRSALDQLASKVAASAATWGNITGTLSSQTDLQNALDAKYDASNPSNYITSAQAPVQSVNTKTGIVVLDKSDVGLGNVDNTSDLNKPISTATQDALDDKYDASNPSNYITSAEAPVQSVNTKTGIVVLDKSDVGLGNVDNTSDLNKPISTATQDALDDKYDASNPAGYITSAGAPVQSVNSQTGIVVLTKSDVGLGSVDNTSDLDKPISTATQDALDDKEPTITAGTTSQYYRGDKTFQTLNLGAIDQSSATTGQVPVWNGTSWVPDTPAGSAVWGAITGTLSSQTDLQSALDGKFDDPTGTTSQYIRGDGSLATFPSIISQAGSLVTTVFNNTGSTLSKFSVVYINGGQGDLPTVALAQANSELTSSKTYGVIYADIPNMQSGQVIVAGALTGVNTDQFNPTAPTGDVNGVGLYLSPTVPGGLTTTKPSAPNNMVYVATIVRTHQTQGVVEVRIQNGFELEELHNVAITTPVPNNQVLKYDSVTSLWKNQYIGLATDIEHTSFSGANNQSSFANITGLAFDNTLVRAARVLMSISVVATSSLYEEVEISVINKNGDFAISTEGMGDNSLVKFNITSAGQIQYTSSNYSGFSSLTIKFRALTTSV
jgi:hypothetical protein